MHTQVILTYDSIGITTFVGIKIRTHLWLTLLTKNH